MGIVLDLATKLMLFAGFGKVFFSKRFFCPALFSIARLVDFEYPLLWYSKGPGTAKYETPTRIGKKNLVHPARMAIAAVLGLLAARALGLPEVYWAPIAALIVLQNPDAYLAASWLLLVGTALGVSLGALLATSIGPGVIILALAIFGMGLLSATLRLDRRANHFAAIAIIIVLLAGPADKAWLRAFHRFAEFSAGIIAALVLSAVWREQPSGKTQNQSPSSIHG